MGDEELWQLTCSYFNIHPDSNPPERWREIVRQWHEGTPEQRQRSLEEMRRIIGP